MTGPRVEWPLLHPIRLCLDSQVMACLDLLIRWCVLRIVESNTQSLVKVSDLLKAVMDAMSQAGIRWEKQLTAKFAKLHCLPWLPTSSSSPVPQYTELFLSG